MAPVHWSTVEFFDAFPCICPTTEKQNAIRPEYAAEAGKNLKVFVLGNMKETVKR